MPLYGGVSQSDLSQAIASIPAPATTVPPGIGVTGLTGNTSTAFARADHTHASSVQRAILAVTGSTMTWTFPKPYAVIPVVTCTVETPGSSTQPYVGVLIGSPTLTTATFAVYKAQPTTLGATLLALAGLVITPFAAVPGGINLHCWAALPTT